MKRDAVKFKTNRKKTLALVDSLHANGFPTVLVEDFDMDLSKWARIILPDREIHNERFDALITLAQDHDASMSLEMDHHSNASRIVLWVR